MSSGNGLKREREKKKKQAKIQAASFSQYKAIKYSIILSIST